MECLVDIGADINSGAVCSNPLALLSTLVPFDLCFLSKTHHTHLCSGGHFGLNPVLLAAFTLHVSAETRAQLVEYLVHPHPVCLPSVYAHALGDAATLAHAHEGTSGAGCSRR
jgi:hypothetical protein